MKWGDLGWSLADRQRAGKGQGKARQSEGSESNQISAKGRGDEAGEVQPGCRVYNSKGSCQAATWQPASDLTTLPLRSHTIYTPRSPLLTITTFRYVH